MKNPPHKRRFLIRRKDEEAVDIVRRFFIIGVSDPDIS